MISVSRKIQKTGDQYQLVIPLKGENYRISVGYIRFLDAYELEVKDRNFEVVQEFKGDLFKETLRELYQSLNAKIGQRIADENEAARKERLCQLRDACSLEQKVQD